VTTRIFRSAPLICIVIVVANWRNATIENARREKIWRREKQEIEKATIDNRRQPTRLKHLRQLDEATSEIHSECAQRVCLCVVCAKRKRRSDRTGQKQQVRSLKSTYSNTVVP